MTKFGQFLTAFRARETAGNLTAELYYPEQAEYAERRMPIRIQRDVPSARFDLGGNAAFHLAATSFNPCAMTDKDNHRLADLLLDAGAISLEDYNILVRGPERRRCGTLAEVEAPRNYLADWQESLAAHMGHDNYAAMDLDSRALNVLGKILVAREAAA